MWLVLYLTGCGGGAAPPPGTTPGAPCPDGRPSALAEPAVEVERWVPGTRVSTCTTGPHAEDWPSGGPAARGERKDGYRSGVWTRWTDDGRFEGRVEYAGGVPLRREEPGTDGRITEWTFSEGRVVALRTLPRGTPRPEWSAGTLADGTRYSD